MSSFNNCTKFDLDIKEKNIVFVNCNNKLNA